MKTRSTRAFSITIHLCLTGILLSFFGYLLGGIGTAMLLIYGHTSLGDTLMLVGYSLLFVVYTQKLGKAIKHIRRTISKGNLNRKEEQA